MNAKSDKSPEHPRSDKQRAKKASTNELPMVDLDSVLGFVDKIEADGLQTLSQQEVAKRLGYATQTSTPFYRRIVGARLFGLIDTTQGVNLTKLALDYFKPLDEESKRQALATAVKNVVGYQGIIERFSGKRLPPLDILKNSIEREFDLATEAANTCADVFVRSIKSAGLVKADGTLGPTATEQASVQASSERSLSHNSTVATPAVPATPSDASESHYLTLDAKRNRRVIMHAPPIITAAELNASKTGCPFNCMSLTRLNQMRRSKRWSTGGTIPAPEESHDIVRLSPISQRNLIARLRQLGWRGPIYRSDHPFMLKEGRPPLKYRIRTRKIFRWICSLAYYGRRGYLGGSGLASARRRLIFPALLP